MRSVGLITAPEVTLETFRPALERRFDVTLARPIVGGPRLVIEHGQTYALLEALGDGPERYDEYEPGELDVVGQERMAFFDLQYRSIAFLKRVLQVIADDPGIWVDLDDGTILHGPDLAARLRREPTWLLEQPTVTGD